jgi:hypothetical protein
MKFFKSSFHGWFLLFIALGQLAAIAAESPWQRVVVVGASASSGFVLSEPFGGTNTARCQLDQYLNAAIIPPHAPVKSLATALLFMNPETLGPMQIEAVTNAHPTLVVGVDFLFWFCYGEGGTDAAHARRFENGLKLLEQISCPLVVGDIPDASSATNTGIISPAQVPSETARRAANRRLREWAAARPGVVVVSLEKFMRAAMANQSVTIRGRTLPAGQTRTLLQSDQLHPTPQGAAVLALEILDGLVTRQPEFGAADVRWNSGEVLRRGGPSAR